MRFWLLMLDRSIERPERRGLRQLKGLPAQQSPQPAQLVRIPLPQAGGRGFSWFWGWKGRRAGESRRFWKLLVFLAASGPFVTLWLVLP